MHTHLIANLFDAMDRLIRRWLSAITTGSRHRRT
jgi:hypothetical protein